MLEQAGVIKIIKDGQQLNTPFLDIKDIVRSGGERGLLGLAFHPKFEYNGYFYLNFTNKDGDTVIARYTVSAERNVADSKSFKLILSFKQPYSNHNGGGIPLGLMVTSTLYCHR